MAESVQRRSPLQVEAWASDWPNLIVRDDVVLREVGFVSQINLRVALDSAAAARVASALRVALPTTPNTTATSGHRTALWLGPDEWLVVGPPDDAPVIETLVREALAGGSGSVVDVSANRTVLELSGRAARDVLGLGCPLDLHARTFARGACAQTLLAKAQVILWQRDAAPTYWVFVRASFATYLADWFARAVPDRM